MVRWGLVLVLMLLARLAIADTAAGVAAYERGDYKTALELLKPEAERGDPVAQVKYGLIFAKGLGVPKDASAAVPWFRKSAEQGNAEGQYAMGVAYDVGDAGPPDLNQALIWYRKSAEQGYAKGQYNLGHILLTGADASQHAEGAKWALKAAQQGMSDAMHLYGNSCMKGIGTEQNVLCARYWLSRAVAEGSPKAQDNLTGVTRAIAEIEALGTPRTMGGDGLSTETAIVLTDAKTEREGVKAEHAVTSAYFQGWRWKSQGLVNTPEGGLYDAVTLVKPDGTDQVIYFDIRNWFGKME